MSQDGIAAAAFQHGVFSASFLAGLSSVTVVCASDFSDDWLIPVSTAICRFLVVFFGTVIVWLNRQGCAAAELLVISECSLSTCWCGS